MITLIITNNSSADFRFAKRSFRAQPRINAGQTGKFENLSEADLEIWRAQIEQLQASADFDVIIIDDLRRTLYANGNVVLGASFKIGTAARPFSIVKVEGNLSMSNGEAGDLFCDTLDVTGFVSLWGTGTTRVRRASIDGNLTCVGGTHTISDTFVDGNLITNGGTLNAKRLHVDGTFACGAAGTLVADALFVAGTSTVTAGGTVTTKDARCIGAKTGTITNTAPVSLA